MNGKYFNELSFHPHLDIRYGKTNIPLQYKNIEFKYLLRELSKLFMKNNIKLIIMHGSLIGWYFNREMLPWDDDIDICVLEDSISKLFELHGHETENYMFEVNPNSKNRSPSDIKNVIDARLISKKSGIFIDITFLTKSTKKGYINCKSPHYYKISDILPLSETIFEDCFVYVPSNYKNCLLQEYGNKVFNFTYRNWRFINKKWIKNNRNFISQYKNNKHNKFIKKKYQM